MLRFLSNRAAIALTAVLLLQGGAYYAVASRPEVVPNVAPLDTFPQEIGRWQMVREFAMEQEVLDVLKADDTLNRVYDAGAGGGEQTALFIAFFRTQRAGQMPHSPKNCLPGSGWAPVESGYESIEIPGRAEPIQVNRYVVQHGDEMNVTFYWYQNHKRVIASEYEDRLWLIADAIRYNRSDASLIRVSVPVRNQKVDAADRVGVEFIRSLFPVLTQRLPS